MNIDRVDFTDSLRCCFCKRPLPLGIAHIVIADDQTEVAAGPACARKQAKGAGFPNFTRGAHYTEEQIEPADGPIARRRSDDSDEDRHAETERIRAITYLRLRQEKMNEFASVRYEALEPIYQRHRSGVLSADDIARVGRLMVVVEQRHPLLSLAALQTAYAYHKLLQRGAEKIPSEEKRRYLLSLDEYLRANLRLTPAQIEGANRWLERLGQVRLRRCAYW